MTDATANRRAFVTGAASGLGREIALGLARDGYDLALTYHNTALPDDLLAHPDMAKVTVLPVAMELLSQESIEQGIATAVEGLGGLDVLVNNAARALIKPAIDIAWEEWDSLIDVNLKGAYFLAGRFARHCMDSDRSGVVINIASTHGMTGFPGRTVYGISKGGLLQMTRMLAIEWAEADIRVNAVAPTTVLTESRRQSLKDPEVRQRMLDRIPLGRFPEPEEVAAAVRYLAGPDAVSVTGQVITVDGGLTAA